MLTISSLSEGVMKSMTQAEAFLKLKFNIFAHFPKSSISILIEVGKFKFCFFKMARGLNL